MLHYTAHTTLHFTPRHDTARHYTTLITLHYTTTTTTLQLQLQYLTQDYTTLYHTTLHNTTRHRTALHYTNYITPRLQLQLHLITFITLHLQLHYTTLQLQLQLQLQLHYTTLHPAVVVRWPLQPLQPFQKTQLQPPVGPSVDSLCHLWLTTTNLSYYSFPIFETSATALCGTTGISTRGWVCHLTTGQGHTLIVVGASKKEHVTVISADLLILLQTPSKSTLDELKPWTVQLEVTNFILGPFYIHGMFI